MHREPHALVLREQCQWSCSDQAVQSDPPPRLALVITCHTASAMVLSPLCTRPLIEPALALKGS